MTTSLPLNHAETWIINRDIALLLCVLFVIALIFRIAKIQSQRPFLKPVIAFLRDSYIELGVIFILRAFFYEMYIIPSASMQPTVYAGDVILVNKYSYGMKIPGLNTVFLEGHPPERGDVVVFLDPEQPTVRKMIKRLIGLPGDRIEISKTQMTINGQALPTQYQSQGFEYLPSPQYGSVKMQTQFYNQTIDAHEVSIQRIPAIEDDQTYSLEVPEGVYFVMGDNRENSKDSRYIGYVPQRFLCGKAEYVVMSFGRPHGYYEWGRLGALP